MLTLRDGASVDGYTGVFNGGANTAGVGDTVQLDIAGSLDFAQGAVTAYENLLKSNTGTAILSGAHAVQMVSAVLQQGPGRFREMAQGLRAWMTRHRYDSIESFRGRLHAHRQTHPAQAERAGYAMLLKAWSGGAG